MKRLSTIAVAILRSRAFFAIVLSIFIAEAMWIAISSRYPMAFDEDYHMGAIRLYAHQWSPLFLHQPDGPAPYGALTRDPSYLYHWLMSFPYRWLTSWSNSQEFVVVALRGLNVLMFAGGIVLFRQLFTKTKASKAIIHVTLLLFVLIPVVPLLAAHVNYDNLLMLLIPLNLLLALRLHGQLERRRSNVPLLFMVVSLSLLASLVKFAYLPILTAIVLYLAFDLWRFAHSRRKLLTSLKKGWTGQPRMKRYASLAVLVVSVGLFVQMYGVNIVKYHNIVPQCGQVLSVERCLAYGPWARNYHYAQGGRLSGLGNPAYFTAGWVWGMFDRSFFAINGPTGPAPYANKSPMPLLSLAAITTFVFGLFLLWRYRKQLMTEYPFLGYLLFLSCAYVVALFARNYYDYLQLAHLAAINGRYLVIVILPLLLAIGLAYQRFLRREQLAVLSIVVILLFLQGGGALTFIYDSNANWYWPNNAFVLHLNQVVQRIVRPFILAWPRF